jgi:hypothetical protein
MGAIVYEDLTQCDEMLSFLLPWAVDVLMAAVSALEGHASIFILAPRHQLPNFIPSFPRAEFGSRPIGEEG